MLRLEIISGAENNLEVSDAGHLFVTALTELL